MKYITPQQYERVCDSILEDAKKRAKELKQEFHGISSTELIDAVNHKIGEEWVMRKEESVKFTPDDINAVANSRFYKKTGLKILMLWVIIVLVISQLAAWFPTAPVAIYYAAYSIVTVISVYLYAKKQRDARRELWKGIEGDSIETAR